ncbi:MAG TPA: hypothetical protein VGJ30_06145 [Candidatus Angelobacter sp.]
MNDATRVFPVIVIIIVILVMVPVAIVTVAPVPFPSSVLLWIFRHTSPFGNLMPPLWAKFLIYRRGSCTGRHCPDAKTISYVDFQEAR